MRQVINAVVRANVVVNRIDRALVADVVARILHHLKPAQGRTTYKSWQTPWFSTCGTLEQMLMGPQLVLMPISSVRLPSSRS
ncbi:MAG: hypothetical protein U0905_06265 [Pirellulales bacterium]